MIARGRVALIAGAVVVVAIAACAPGVEITGAVQLGADCDPSAKSPLLFRPLLDIGADPGHAHAYVAALTVTTYVGGVVTFDRADSFFTIDGATFDNEHIPTSAERASHASMSGTSANDVVFATAVTKGDAAEMQSDNTVINAIDAAEQASVVAHVHVSGTAESGARVESQWFTLPITLCIGCLVSEPGAVARIGNAQPDGSCGSDANGAPIAAVANPALCVEGDDVPSLVCPAR